VATRWGIAALVEATGLPQLVCWFIAGGAVMVTLLVAALAATRAEGHAGVTALRARLRLGAPGRGDWRALALAALLIMAATGGVTLGLRALLPSFSPVPPFLQVEPLQSGERWVLLAWAPFFFFNIVGEELLWRGYLLPRQERVWGPHAWLVNGALWTLFHVSFGTPMMVMLLPVMLGLPWVVQRRGNTWVGILLHAAINGPGFIAVSLGLVPT
jgi:membrane protease YdiL (CAAX protease family)